MLNKQTCRSLSLYRLDKCFRLCFSCKRCTQRSSNTIRIHLFSTLVNQNYGRGGETRRQHSTSASVATEKSETPRNLPDEPTAWLPRSPTQRQPRSKHIVPNDLQATIRAHKAANTLDRGYLRVDLQEDWSIRTPRKLAVDLPELARFKEPKYEGKQELVVRSKRKRIRNTPVGDLTELHHKFMALDQNCDALSRLDAEIKVFAEHMVVSKEEETAVGQIFEHLQKQLKRAFPDYTIEIQGSRVNGLARPLSDIDIRLSISDMEKSYDERGPSPHRPKANRQHVTAVNSVRRYLKQEFNHIYKVGQIRPGRVPLLDLYDNKHQLAIQLVPIHARSNRATEHAKYIQSEYPQIKPLFVLLRWWTRQIDLDDASQGGISSYLTFNMIVTSITHSKELHGRQELGRQLINFFEFWSEADIETLGYASDPPRTFPKYAKNIVEESMLDGGEIESNSDAYLEGIKYLTTQAQSRLKAKKSKPSDLLLQDLADPLNNVGNSAQRFTKFQGELRTALLSLRQSMTAWDKKQKKQETAIKPKHDHSIPAEQLVSGKGIQDKTLGTASSSYLIKTLLEAGVASRTNSLHHRLKVLERGRRRIEAAQQE